MDELIDAVAAHLCRHRSVGLFRLMSGVDLAQWRLRKTPGTEAWRAAVRETVYALRERELAQS